MSAQGDVRALIRKRSHNLQNERYNLGKTKGDQMSGKMKLQFDFYEKNEFSIQLDGQWPPFDNKESELFIFAAFVLRQMHNIGSHIIMDALAGALIDNPEKLLAKNPTISNGLELLTRRQAYFLKASGMSDSDLGVEVINIIYNLKKNPLVEALDTYTLSPIPKLIEYKGDARRQFIFNMPGQRLDIKGFGFIGTLLGKDMGFYAFASSLALYRFLGEKHKNDSEYIARLYLAGEICAGIQYRNVVPVDQTVAGEYIVNMILGNIESARG